MTKPIPVISRWERFKRLTVWHPINTNPQDAYRHGPRFWYPGFDLIMVVLGAYAFVYGSPLLNRLFPTWFVDTLGVAILISALFASAGVVFPKLFMVELVGKLSLVFLLGGYAGTVAALSRTDEPNGFVVIVLFALVWLLGPRLSWLFIRLGEWFSNTKLGQRVNARRTERELNKAYKRALKRALKGGV